MNEELSEQAVELFYTDGYAKYKFGNSLQAMETFRFLCAKRPFEARFWFALGASCQELKQYEAALSAWAMAWVTDKEDPYPHFHAAECAYLLGKLKDAQQALKEAELRLKKVVDHPLHQRISALRQSWKCR